MVAELTAKGRHRQEGHRPPSRRIQAASMISWVFRSALKDK
jgi:hypothetical protein